MTFCTRTRTRTRTFTRRGFGLALLAAACGTTPALAQLAGADTMSIIVPYATGGSSDAVGRALQPAMAKALGKTMIVENIAGVAGALGSQKLLSSPVGQAVLIGSANDLVLPPLALKVVKYKPQDFKLVSTVVFGPLVLFARPDLPANSIEEMAKLAKAPGAKPLTYASTGKGSQYHLLSEGIAARLGLTMTQIPYRGVGPAAVDLAGGQLDIALLPMAPQFLQMVEKGQLKVLGVTSDKRSPALPKAAAFGEVAALKDFLFEGWVGVFVPAGMDAQAAARIGKAANDAAALPEFQKLLTMAGASPAPALTLDQAAAFYAKEIDRYQQLARSVKLEAE
jgi:tripartite-type tricarboxylate transporter receptor subunit TctC